MFKSDLIKETERKMAYKLSKESVEMAFCNFAKFHLIKFKTIVNRLIFLHFSSSPNEGGFFAVNFVWGKF